MSDPQMDLIKVLREETAERRQKCSSCADKGNETACEGCGTRKSIIELERQLAAVQEG